MPRAIRFHVIAVVVLVAASCSSPTQPSARPIAVASAASLAQAPGGDVCAAYTGAATGLCQALFAMGCTGSGPTPERCDRMIDTFRNVTGSSPTFVVREYVSRDPQVCVAIRFLCRDGYQPFYDDSGCGCDRLP